MNPNRLENCCSVSKWSGRSKRPGERAKVTNRNFSYHIECVVLEPLGQVELRSGLCDFLHFVAENVDAIVYVRLIPHQTAHRVQACVLSPGV